MKYYSSAKYSPKNYDLFYPYDYIVALSEYKAMTHLTNKKLSELMGIHETAVGSLFNYAALPTERTQKLIYNLINGVSV